MNVDESNEYVQYTLVTVLHFRIFKKLITSNHIHKLIILDDEHMVISNLDLKYGLYH